MTRTIGKTYALAQLIAAAIAGGLVVIRDDAGGYPPELQAADFEKNDPRLLDYKGPTKVSAKSYRHEPNQQFKPHNVRRGHR